MNSTLELAMAKVSELPEEAQERIGLELLDRLAAMEGLRADIEVGIQELDAGLGRPLDIDDVIRRARERRGERDMGLLRASRIAGDGRPAVD